MSLRALTSVGPLARTTATLYGGAHGISVFLHDSMAAGLGAMLTPLGLIITIALFEEWVLAEEVHRWWRRGHHRWRKHKCGCDMPLPEGL